MSAPWGAFPEGGSLRVALRDHAAVLPPSSWPSFAVARAAARLELSVAAARSLQLLIPGEPPADPAANFHACMRIEVAGRPHPMLVRTARWDPDRQAYLTADAADELPASAAEALAQAAASGNPDPLLAGIRRSMDLVILEPLLPGGRKSALAAKAGRILLLDTALRPKQGDVEVAFHDATGIRIDRRILVANEHGADDGIQPADDHGLGHRRRSLHHPPGDGAAGPGGERRRQRAGRDALFQ